jgi:hypothetical protein
MEQFTPERIIYRLTFPHSISIITSAILAVSLSRRMKKIIVAISALCYFIVTCGVVVNFHYCMNRLASTAFYAGETKKCGKCGMEIHESKGCCRDEVRIVKLHDDQNKTLIPVYTIPAIEPVEIIPSEFIVAEFYNNSGQLHFQNHSPPLLSAQDTYLQNNVFRI